MDKYSEQVSQSVASVLDKSQGMCDDYVSRKPEVKFQVVSSAKQIAKELMLSYSFVYPLVSEYVRLREDIVIKQGRARKVG